MRTYTMCRSIPQASTSLCAAVLSFTVKGLEAGGVGAAQAFLHGHVYHVTKVADFAGLYGAVDIGFTVLGGQGGMAMRNQHGVLIYLESVESGVQLTLSVAGIEILLQS